MVLENKYLPTDLPETISKLNNDELIKKIDTDYEVQECLEELAIIYGESKQDKCFRVPFHRGQIVDFITQEEINTGMVVGYEFGIRPNGEYSNLVMVAFYKDKKMRKLDEVLAFPIEELITNIDGVPIAPDTTIMAFGGQMDKKIKEI